MKLAQQPCEQAWAVSGSDPRLRLGRHSLPPPASMSPPSNLSKSVVVNSQPPPAGTTSPGRQPHHLRVIAITANLYTEHSTPLHLTGGTRLGGGCWLCRLFTGPPGSSSPTREGLPRSWSWARIFWRRAREWWPGLRPQQRGWVAAVWNEFGEGLAAAELHCRPGLARAADLESAGAVVTGPEAGTGRGARHRLRARCGGGRRPNRPSPWRFPRRTSR